MNICLCIIMIIIKIIIIISSSSILNKTCSVLVIELNIQDRAP